MRDSSIKEHLLHHNEEFLCSHADFLFVLNPEGRILDINEKGLDLLGYSKKELMDSCFSALLNKRLAGSITDDMVERIIRKELLDENLGLLCKDGFTNKSIKISTKWISTEDGSLRYILGIGKDMTEKENIELELQNKISHMDLIAKINEEFSVLVKEYGDSSFYEGTAKIISEFFGFELCTIHLLEGKNSLKLVAKEGELGKSLPIEAIRIRSAAFQSLLYTMKPVFLYPDDGKKYHAIYDQVFENKEIKQIVILPLVCHEEFVGTISIASLEIINPAQLRLLFDISTEVSSNNEKLKLYVKQKKDSMGTTRALVLAIEARDKYTRGHSERVSEYCTLIGENLKLGTKEIEELRIAALLHDIGKIGIPDSILLKEGQLTEAEYSMIKEHSTIGFKILENVGLSNSIISGILYHHKRVDLSGYPEKIQLGSLPLFARIIGVADSFDAMTSDRSYRKGLAFDEAVAELIKNKGTQFCPEIVDCFIEAM